MSLKLKRFLQILSVCALITTSASLASSRERAEGPRDGGGGSLQPTKPATKAELVDAIYHGLFDAKALLSFLASEGRILHSFETQRPIEDNRFDDKSDPTGVFRLMFEPKNGPNVFGVFRELLIDLKEDAPCIDPVTKKPAQGAARQTSDDICISLPMLVAAKVASSEVTAKTVILLVHELAHRMGADEVQAVAMESYARSYLDTWSGSSASFWGTRLRTLLEITNKFLIVAVQPSTSLASLCFDLGKLDEKATELYGKYFSEHANPIGADRQRMLALIAKIQLLESACGRQPRTWVRKNLGETKRVSACAYFGVESIPALCDLVRDVADFRLAANGDRTAIAEDLVEINNLSSRLLSSVNGQAVSHISRMRNLEPKVRKYIPNFKSRLEMY